MICTSCHSIHPTLDPSFLRAHTVAVLVSTGLPESRYSVEAGDRIYRALCTLGVRTVKIEWESRELVECLKATTVAFNCVYGHFGESGHVSALLEYLRIPYTGSGVFASALTFNKLATKQVLTTVSVRMPRTVYPSDELQESSKHLAEQLPLIRKPIQGGGSHDVELIEAHADLLAFLQSPEACCYMLEEYIAGRDVCVCVLESGGEPVALPPITVATSTPIFTPDQKHDGLKRELTLLASESQSVAEIVTKTALQAHKALRCRGWSKVDFRFDGDQAYLIEVDAIPGMGPASILPFAAEEVGWNFNIIVLEVLRNALQARPF